MSGVNRNYKDSLFRRLFTEKEELLSLYNAINETEYTETDALEITTIDDVLYMDYKNDLSMVLDFRLGIYEHQSTWCGNIPVRVYIYSGRVLSKLLRKKDLYGSTTVKIPNPQFVVFYNGQK